MSGTIATAEPSAPPRPKRTTQFLAWQGWRLRVPSAWNPITLEGSFDKGHALLADMDGPRLGLRWRRVGVRRVTPALLQRVMRDEVGAEGRTTTADEALTHLDPNPPGRDVAVRWFADSERLIQIAYHARRRDRMLVDELLPSLADVSASPSRPWAVLDLSCIVPAELALRGRRLNAGDLTLHFANGRRFVSVRQLALARVALTRMPLEAWLAEQQRARRGQYRPTGDVSTVTIDTPDVTGLVARARRRGRFFWRRGLHHESFTLALHDERRDRLILVEASDLTLARGVAMSVGRGIDG